MSFTVERAKIEDCDQLLALYAQVYGPNYPLSFGTDREVMERTIQDQNQGLWLLARETESGKISGSVVYDIDQASGIGRIVGLVVDPKDRKQRLASRLIEEGSAQLLCPSGPVSSLYATTRTNAIGVQLIFLKLGFLPLGIFPNAHKLEEYETLALFAKHKPGVMEKRVKVGTVPKELGGLLRIQAGMGIPPMASTGELPDDSCHAPGTPLEKTRGAQSKSALEFEFILAPQFVQRQFNERMRDPYDRFYPFHTPNMLIASKNGEIEIYAYFSKQDHYCAIVALTTPVSGLEGRMEGLLRQLGELGVSYLELLLELRFGRSIQAALGAGFVPSAIYPAMREVEGQMHDFVVLSRTMEPLNFRGMAVAQSLKLYVDQYVALWTKKHLLSIEVIPSY